MEAPDFWDDAEVSQKKMKELKDMKDDMETYQNLITQMEDMETMIESGKSTTFPTLKSKRRPTSTTSIKCIPAWTPNSNGRESNSV